MRISFHFNESWKSSRNKRSSPRLSETCWDRSKLWIVKLFTEIFKTEEVSNTWKNTKIIAFLKPNNPPVNPKIYQPISLPSTLYTFIERVVLRRLAPILENVILQEQAGFRPGRNCWNHILALTTYIESGFQKWLNTAADFIDLCGLWHGVA